MDTGEVRHEDSEVELGSEKSGPKWNCISYSSLPAFSLLFNYTVYLQIEFTDGTFNLMLYKFK